MDGGRNFWGRLDRAFKTSQFLNAFIGICTFLIVLLCWVVVCYEEANIKEDFWSDIKPLIMFGDSFVPTAITYCLGIIVQSVILLEERKLEYFSGIILSIALTFVQIACYLVFRRGGITNTIFLIMLYGVGPFIIATCSLLSCKEKSDKSSISLSG